ncbi:DNA polymerase theta, partial [Araneus ventricosus]
MKTCYIRLTFDERDIIEGAFRQGILKILVATSTLSSGVNLPARRVIIRSPMFCGAVIDALSYKQMVGRAGRKGIDEKGESILLCKESEKNAALTLVNSELPPVKSCLLKSGSSSVHSSLKRALIEVIASGVASSQKEVQQYISCTLLYASIAAENETSGSNVGGSIEKCIEYLVDNDIIFKNEETVNDSCEISYKPTQLGLAILASGFSPDDALRVLKELQLARRCFVLENDLHILYE